MYLHIHIHIYAFVSSSKTKAPLQTVVAPAELHFPSENNYSIFIEMLSKPLRVTGGGRCCLGSALQSPPPSFFIPCYSLHFALFLLPFTHSPSSLRGVAARSCTSVIAAPEERLWLRLHASQLQCVLIDWVCDKCRNTARARNSVSHRRFPQQGSSLCLPQRQWQQQQEQQQQRKQKKEK